MNKSLNTFALLLALAAAGCNIGTGGTGELVIPKDTLRHIQPMDMNDISIPQTQPTSQIAATQPATAPVAEMRLSITDVRKLALNNNLELRVDLLDPTIAKQSIDAEEARYEWLFSADASLSKTDQPLLNTTQGSQSDSRQLTPGLTIPLRTGGSIQLDAPISRFQTDSTFQTLAESYTSDFSASISQPLLRGAGIETNALPLRLAFYSWQQSEAQTKLAVIRVLTDAERVYWRLYAARLQLEVRRKEYELATAQLERAKRQIRAGVIAEVDVVRAESGVADTLEQIIISENIVRNRQRELKRILNDPQLPMEGPTVVIPDTLPAPVSYKVDKDRLIKAAMNQRMELLQTEIQIASSDAQVHNAKNDLLPLLSLTYRYNTNGVGSRLGRAVDQAADNDFADNFASLRLEFPIGNGAARARYRSAIAARLQSLATKAQRAQLIQQEVYNAIDALEENWQRILATRERTILASRTLAVETRQFDLGLRTSTEVLDAQTKLADAQSSEISALSDYQIAQIDIAFATGTVLGASKIIWQPTPAPKSP